MKYWLIYIDDFSNEGWVIRDFACFYTKEDALWFKDNIMEDDEHTWTHVLEEDSEIKSLGIYLAHPPKK